MKIEQTLVLIKPDAVERGLIGNVIGRFEQRGLKIVGLKMIKASDELARDHYGDFVQRYTPKLGAEKAQSIMDEMAGFLSSGPLIAMVVEGIEAVTVVRKIVGSTYPNEAAPGTIRGDFAHVSQDYANAKGITVKNIVHASGSVEEASIEIKLWFGSDELIKYSTVHDRHVF